MVWTDLGEIIRLNQAYTVGLDGFERRKLGAWRNENSEW
jgi:hypothetical protein